MFYIKQRPRQFKNEDAWHTTEVNEGEVGPAAGILWRCGTMPHIRGRLKCIYDNMWSL